MNSLVESCGRYLEEFRRYNAAKNSCLKYYFKLYHRIRIIGAGNIPGSPALIAANHSGGFDLDTIAVSACGHPHRDIRVLYWEKYHFLNHWWGRYGIGDSVPVWLGKELPWELLDRYFIPGGDRFPGLLCVFPEGSSRLFGERHSLGRFYPGVVRIAMRYRLPVVPAAMTGFHLACPVLKSVRNDHGPDDPIYFPPLVLPFRLTIEYGEPVGLSGYYGRELSKDEEFMIANDIIRPRVCTLLKKYDRKFSDR